MFSFESALFQRKSAVIKIGYFGYRTSFLSISQSCTQQSPTARSIVLFSHRLDFASPLSYFLLGFASQSSLFCPLQNSSSFSFPLLTIHTYFIFSSRELKILFKTTLRPPHQNTSKDFKQIG